MFVSLKGVKYGKRENIEEDRFSQGGLVDKTLYRNNYGICTWPYSVEVICLNTS
jgi:hypothetical protein